MCKAPSSLENMFRPRCSVRYSKIQKKERQWRAKTRLLERLLEHQGRNIRLLEHPIQQTQGSENRIEIPRVSNGISGPSPLFNQGGGIQKLTYTIPIDRTSNLFIKRAVNQHVSFASNLAGLLFAMCSSDLPHAGLRASFGMEIERWSEDLC